MTGIVEHPARVLVVEDDLANRVLLTRLLERVGYAVDAVADGHAALEAVLETEADVVLLDIGLPGIDGLEVCRQLRANPATTTIPVILLTGRTTLDDVVEGLDAGADDFVGKPFETPELLARIRSVLRLRRAMADMEAAHGVVAALANAVEAKDVTTEHHCQRLATHARRLCEHLGMDAADVKAVVYGAVLHDVGKIGIAESILSKPGALTELEWVEMRRHPEIGEQICRPLASSRQFTPIVRHHHERWDAGGYPDGLRGEAIPVGARIVALIDAFDAMVNDRPYRAARSVADAVTELRSLAGRQFDPGLVPVFLELLEADPAAARPHGRLSRRLPALRAPT